MVQFSLGNSGKFLNTEWHEERQNALETAHKVEEFGDIERTRFDLDNLKFNREAKDSYYQPTPELESEGSAQSSEDIRNIDEIRD